MSPKNANKKLNFELVALVLTFLFSVGLLFFVLRSFRDDEVALRAGSETKTDYSYAQRVINLPFSGPQAFCLSADGGFWIAKEGAVVKVTDSGKVQEQIEVAGKVAAIECSSSKLFFATAKAIFKVDLTKEERAVSSFVPLPEGTLITSLALSADRLFAADCAGRQVFAFDARGEKLWQTKGEKPFVIPSPYFDLCPDDEGGIWVTNPGLRRLERYDKDGRYKALWQPQKSEQFIGCCNPAMMNVFPDGRVVTLEKGLVRCRLFSPAGNVERVLVAPGTLVSKDFTYDLAVAEGGGVYVLVKHANSILKVR